MFPGLSVELAMSFTSLNFSISKLLFLLEKDYPAILTNMITSSEGVETCNRLTSSICHGRMVTSKDVLKKNYFPSFTLTLFYIHADIILRISC